MDWTDQKLPSLASLLQEADAYFQKPPYVPAEVDSDPDTIARVVLRTLENRQFIKSKPKIGSGPLGSDFEAIQNKISRDPRQSHYGFIANSKKKKLPLLVRIPISAVKIHGAASGGHPDFAEFVMLYRLAKLRDALAKSYGDNVVFQVMPHDTHAKYANNYTDEAVKLYLVGIQELVRKLEANSWLRMEVGSERLYLKYEVERYCAMGTAIVLGLIEYFPGWANKVLEQTRARAKKVYVFAENNKDERDTFFQINAAAIKYMEILVTENLSGLMKVGIGPEPALPITFSPPFHDGIYRIFCFNRTQDRLPWNTDLWAPEVITTLERNKHPLEPAVAGRLQMLFEGIAHNGDTVNGC